MKSFFISYLSTPEITKSWIISIRSRVNPYTPTSKIKLFPIQLLFCSFRLTHNWNTEMGHLRRQLERSSSSNYHQVFHVLWYSVKTFTTPAATPSTKKGGTYFTSVSNNRATTFFIFTYTCLRTIIKMIIMHMNW